jgi:hypothetical protein
MEEKTKGKCQCKEKKKPEYIKLKEPKDVLAYVQRLINAIRYKNLELDPTYSGKIIYLLNTWLSAYKSHLESTEVEEIKKRLEALEKLQEAKR